MSWALDRRLDYIDWRLARHGEVRRQHLIDAFGISMPQASADLASFEAAHASAMEYDRSRKAYVPAKAPYRMRRELQTDSHGRLVIVIG